jgi:hypothetical protein
MASDIKQFRRDFAALKRSGLLDKKRTRAGLVPDARSIKPGTKLNGVRADTLVRRYDDVVSGKVTPLKVPPAKLKALRKVSGYETSQGRVLVPVSAGEKAVIERGEVVIKSKAGITRVQLPIEFHNLPQYLKSIQRNKATLNDMKSKGQYFGFRFFGNNSSQLFRDIGQMSEFIQSYGTIINGKTKKRQNEIYRNLEIVTVERAADWTFPSERRSQRERIYRAEAVRRFRKRLKRKPAAVRNAYKDANAARVKKWRARLKKNPAAYKRYKKEGAKRARKSQNKGKKK